MKRIRGLIGILLTTLMLCSCSGRTNDFFDENFINNALYYDRSEVNHNLKIFALCSKIKKFKTLTMQKSVFIQRDFYPYPIPMRKMLGIIQLVLYRLIIREI